MKNITLSVVKSKVYDEVAKTTSYAGAKRTEEEGAYERMFTTDADQEMLERFWGEACNGATDEFKQFIVSVSDKTSYTVSLELSARFDERLKSSMESSLFSYFVNAIVSKWFRFTNQQDAEAYGADAVAALQDVESKMYYRVAPQRKAIV